MNMATFFDQTKWYSTQKKRLFQMAYFKFHKKKLLRKLKIDRFKEKPLKEKPCTLYIP